MINAKLQNIIDTKSAIGNAINNKGGSITVETPFYEYAPAIENISTGGGAYSTFVAQAQDNSLYTVYNGYDATTNPTPNLSNNFAFNRWLLNNSATGDVVLSNVVVANGGTFNGPNSATNEASMPFVVNSSNIVDANAYFQPIAINNSFVFAFAFTNSFANKAVYKLHESNLVLNINSGEAAVDVNGLEINNAFVYIGGGNPHIVRKAHESNLVFNANSAALGGQIDSLALNNGAVFVANRGGVGSAIFKFHESNLVNIANSGDTNTAFTRIFINDGFVYAGGAFNTVIRKYHESNLVFNINSPASLAARPMSFAANNGYLYVGMQTQNIIRKFYESNLVFVANSSSYGASVDTLRIENGYIYASGGNAAYNPIYKYNESTLELVGQTPNVGAGVYEIAINNGHIYSSGGAIPIRKFQTNNVEQEQIPFYNITNIKE